MNQSSRQLYRSAQVAAMDREAIAVLGIPGLVLMQRAGARAYQLLRATWPDRRRLRVVCGTGNNGGDGYVIALLGLLDGLDVVVYQVGDGQRLKSDAAIVAARYRDAGGVVETSVDSVALEPTHEGLVLVDALFGTGLDRPVSGVWRQAVEAMNALSAPVLAVDIPSGLHGDTGAVLGAAVKADVTITFIALKQGLFTAEGPDSVGRWQFCDLDLPDAARAGQRCSALRVGYSAVKALFPPRARTAHKGRHGHVLVAGGDQGMGGAALLAGMSALRAGAGLVSVVTREAHVSALLAAQPELMVHGIEQPAQAVAEVLSSATLVLLGPGLGRKDWGQCLFKQVLASGKPLVLDADGLNLLAQHPLFREDWVLTPHPGEAATLLGISVAHVQADRFAAAEALVSRYGGVVVLKGAGTVIAGGGRVPAVCDRGNPGLASGGTGDVLAGLTASLRAQGFTLRDAAEAAVCVHAEAGDRLARAGGERGLLASDLPAMIRTLVNS